MRQLLIALVCSIALGGCGDKKPVNPTGPSNSNTPIQTTTIGGGTQPTPSDPVLGPSAFWTYTISGLKGCQPFSPSWEAVINVESAGVNGGHFVTASFHASEAGCEETDDVAGGRVYVTGDNDYLPFSSGMTFVNWRPDQSCGRYQVDIGLDDGDDSETRKTVYAVVLDTGVDCTFIPPPPPPPPPSPPTCEELGNCPEPPCVDCEPPCVEDCEPVEEGGFCHIWAGNDGFNEVTLNIPEGAILAHLRQHQFDYRGPCDGHSPNDEHPEN